MKKLTRMLVIALFVTFNVSGFSPLINSDMKVHANSSYINTGSTAQASYTTLGSYNISKENVKAMANTMRASTGGGAILAEALVSLMGPYAMVASVATALSANAVSRASVMDAADNNREVRVVIKDQPVHTSYSTVVEFSQVY